MLDLSGGDISLHYLPLLLDVDAIRGYSWGSDVLAYLYRQLCVACEVNHKQIGGCLILLQLWASERMYVGRPLRNTEPLPQPFSDVDPLRLGALGYNKWHGPRSYTESPSRVLIYYRDHLDRQRKDDVIWTPYDEESLQMLNPICTEGRELWTAKIIPPTPRTNHHELHRITRKKLKKNWAIEMHQYITLWNERYGSVVEADREEDDAYLSDYFDCSWSTTWSRDFFNNPPPMSNKFAYDPFHLAFNDLVEIGEERALDIDPMLIEMSDDG
ncbi:hypothetical protein QQ045_033370 [Rhodiola kirilowii]